MKRLLTGPSTTKFHDEEEGSGLRSIVTQEIERHVDLFQRCRHRLTGREEDEKEVAHANVNNFLLLLRAADVYSSQSREQAREVMLFAALFCFSQDLDAAQKDAMEVMARETLDCFNVPIQESLYEYFYEKNRQIKL